jgi:RNA polymerase sigma-70 factor (ECF subfamily)
LVDREDLAQEAFLRALGAEDSGAVRNPLHYIIRVARNLFIDRQRKNLRENRAYASLGESRTELLNPERILSAKQELARVAAAIDLLPPRCREAFVLHRFEHLSYPAIARRMGVSTGTVEKHIAHAMLRITQALHLTGEDRS